ncbi:MAG: hypothetical protein ChlgKO_09810 [Chlamydiales bacterium]
MSQSITVTVDKLMTIPEQIAPLCVNQRITELKGSISEKSKSLINPQTIDREISLLEEKLGDGKIWQTSMIWKTALAAGTIFFTVRTGTKQISRGDSVGKVLSWSALRISVTYVAVQSAVRSIQKWPSTSKCIGEIIGGNLKESPFSRLTTILFPFVSRRLDGYNVAEINQELDSLKQEKNEIPTKNEATQREINKLESQVKRVELLKTNFPTLFGSFIKKHKIYKRLEGRLHDVFIETTTDGEKLPLEKDDDWKKVLNSYNKNAPNLREVKGAIIPKLTEDEIKSLCINNIIAVVNNIAEKNLLFDSFATHHRTNTAELVDTFALAFLDEIQCSNDTNKQILDKLIEKSSYILNLPHSGERNLVGHTPAQPNKVSRLGLTDDPSSPTLSAQQGQQLEEGDEDFEVHISDLDDSAITSPEAKGLPVPVKLPVEEQTESPADKTMQYLQELKTPNATRNSTFTEAEQAKAKSFIDAFIEQNPDHAEVPNVIDLKKRVEKNTPGTPKVLTKLIGRLEDGGQTISLVMKPNVLNK